jgi:hypothetical protein
VISFCAAVPCDLHEADDILTKYGRWAAGGGSARTCGSAEGRYRAPGREALEARRQPASPLEPAQRDAAQRALARVSPANRTVLAALYVPSRWPIARQLRAAGVSPRECASLHLHALRQWWGLYGLALRHEILTLG